MDLVPRRDGLAGFVVLLGGVDPPLTDGELRVGHPFRVENCLPRRRCLVLLRVLIAGTLLVLQVIGGNSSCLSLVDRACSVLLGNVLYLRGGDIDISLVDVVRVALFAVALGLFDGLLVSVALVAEYRVVIDSCGSFLGVPFFACCRLCQSCHAWQRRRRSVKVPCLGEVLRAHWRLYIIRFEELDLLPRYFDNTVERPLVHSDGNALVADEPSVDGDSVVLAVVAVRSDQSVVSELHGRAEYFHAPAVPVGREPLLNLVRRFSVRVSTVRHQVHLPVGILGCQ